MSEIAALSIANTLQATTSVLQAADAQISLPSVVTSLPALWADLTTPLTLRALISSTDLTGEVMLETSAGPMSLVLDPTATPQAQQAAQAGSASASQTASILASELDQLDHFIGSGRQITVLLQPGSPPTQAFLMLPTKALGLEPSAKDKPQATPKNAEASFKPGSLLNVVSLNTPTDSAAHDHPEVALSQQAKATLQTFFANKAEAKTNGIIPPTPSFVASKAVFDVKEEAAAPFTKPFSQPPHHSQSAPEVLQTKIVAVFGPHEQTPVLAKGQFLATIQGESLNGKLLLQTDTASLFLQDAGTLPEGTKIVLEHVRKEPVQLRASPDDDQADRPAKALSALAGLLREIDPHAARALFNEPAKPSATPSVFLFLLSALKQGDLPNLLGAHVAETLERSGKKNIIDDLAEDLDDLRQPLRDQTVGQWQAWPLPVYDGSHFKLLQLCVHHEAPQEDSEKASKDLKTRFLISLDLSTLGRMQVDGLSNKKQLDLVIRSEAPLPETLSDDLRALYVSTLEATGLVGGLTFQTGTKNWVYPVQESTATAQNVLT